MGFLPSTVFPHYLCSDPPGLSPSSVLSKVQTFDNARVGDYCRSSRTGSWPGGEHDIPKISSYTHMCHVVLWLSLAKLNCVILVIALMEHRKKIPDAVVAWHPSVSYC